MANEKWIKRKEGRNIILEMGDISIKRLRLTQKEYEALREHFAAPAMYEALKELVELKYIKDFDGKTGDYERRQPLAWKAAREALQLANPEK